MKMARALTLFSFLAFCFFFSGISGEGEQKDECSDFPKPEKGGQVFCTDDLKPVCGTDGRTYSNKCELCAEKAAGVHVHIKHYGNCKPDVCSKFPPQEKGKPPGCPRDYRPVCGTNGVTYANLCLFCEEKRNSEVPLDIKHEGECKEKDECSKFPEPPKGQSVACTLEWKPVCGSDGKTYANLCLFCQEKRQSGNTLTISHKGKCKEKDECSNFPVPPKGKPAACTLELRQVCGSDGVTYSNKCEFCVAKRRSGNKLTIKHEGPCGQKEQKGE